MANFYFRITAIAVLTSCCSSTAVAGEFRRHSKPVAGIYLVELSDKNATSVKEFAKAAGVKFHGKIRDIFDSVIGGFSVEMTEAQALALSSVPGVIAVDEVVGGHPIEAPVERADTTGNWGLDRIDQRGSELDGWYHYYFRGTGVTVYVLDTGVTENGDLQGRISENKVIAGNVGNPGDCQSPLGHGTQVASTIGGSIYGVAKNVTLVNVKVFACRNTGIEPADQMISGINWVVNRHVSDPSALSVINISAEFNPYAPLDQAVKTALDAGIVVVVGAGNEGGSACTSSPQRMGYYEYVDRTNPEVATAITVGGSDRNDQVAYFGVGTDGNSYSSATGRCVDVFAPAGPGLWAQGAGQVDRNWIGTSASAPFVSGLAALTLARFGDITPSMVENYIRVNATSNIVRDNPVLDPMMSSTNNDLVFQVGPGKRRACCS